jgi:arginine utilization protein RocB
MTMQGRVMTTSGHNSDGAYPPDPARAEYWARTMTALPSVSGSADEAAFADKLVALLRAAGLETVWTMEVPGGRHPRSCVAALARGRGRRTVVLTGHFDTVPTEDYGDLQPLALDPDALAAGLAARLGRAVHSPAEIRARDDLATGDYLPGRGLLDMKGGLAAGLAVLEAFMANPDADGNLLFLAVPDEEVNSAGARAAAPLLARAAAEHGLDLVAAINLDAIADDGDGSYGRAIALGTIGKLLPSALVVGRAAHAGYAFDGLGACALAGALAAAIEWSPDLTETTGTEVAAGPTLLGMKDSKTAYDVTMPARVWMYWNVMTHRRGPAELLDKIAGMIRATLDPLVARLRRQREATGAEVIGPVPDVDIVTFADLRAEVTARLPDAAATLAAYAAEVAARHLDLPDQNRLITEKLWELSGRSNPTVVLGFASIPYLPTSLDRDDGARRLADAAAAAAEVVAARHDTTIALQRYFRGISDMSFLGQADEGGVPVIAANTPAWGAGIPWPDGPAFAGIPIVNAGPWGRDYHTVLERMHGPYAFRVLPDLIAEICRRML